MITDETEAIARVISMIKMQRVRAIIGKKIAVKADSICLHGDSPKAVLFAQKIRSALQNEGIKIAAMHEFVE